MDKRDKGYTLYKKGLSCTEISKKLDVSINTVKSWRKRYWTQGADAPAKRTLHPEDAPAAPDPETRPKQGAPPGNVNAVGAGAPKGNRNAVKHGGWSELMFRSWTEEHRQLLDACDEDVDAEELLINELKLLTAREGYLLERISHYSKEGAYSSLFYSYQSYLLAVLAAPELRFRQRLNCCLGNSVLALLAVQTKSP